MSDDVWPDFQREPLDGGRTWSATFQSWDQYHDDLYYVIVVEDGGVAGAPFTAKMDAGWVDSFKDWKAPEFREALRERVGAAAAAAVAPPPAPPASPPREEDLWPTFSTEPASDGNTWSGTFDSFDQYRSRIFYRLTIQLASGAALEPYTQCIDGGWTDDVKDWKGVEFPDELRRRLTDAVVTHVKETAPGDVTAPADNGTAAADDGTEPVVPTVEEAMSTIQELAPADVQLVETPVEAPAAAPVAQLVEMPVASGSGRPASAATTTSYEDYAAFRHAYASVTDAADACPRVDWLVRLAEESCAPKVAVDMGLSAAVLSTRHGELYDMAMMFIPFPGELEAVEAWLGHENNLASFFETRRSTRILVYSCLFALALLQIVIHVVPLGELTQWQVGLCVALILPLSVPFRPLARAFIDGLLHRRARSFDNHSALAAVLAGIHRGNVKNPQLATYMLESTRKRLRAELEHPSEPPEPHPTDDLAVFRAAYTTVDEAIAAVTRPDWYVLLVREARDIRTAIRLGNEIASFLSRRGEFFDDNWPNPSRTETIECWLHEDGGEISGSQRTVRAINLSWLPSVACAYPFTWLVSSEAAKTFAVLIPGLVFLVIWTKVIRAALHALVRRRAAALDADAALDVVLDEISRGRIDEPKRVEAVLRFSRSLLKR